MSYLSLQGIVHSMVNFVTSFWQLNSSRQSLSISPQITSSSEAVRSIKQQLPEVKPSTELFDVDWFHLIDSGGQPQFLDVLPLLFRSESLHIVVIRLTEDLDDKPKVRFYIKGKDYYLVIVLTVLSLITNTTYNVLMNYKYQ